MKHLFNIILYQPLFNLLLFFYQYLHDLGLAIIVLTIFVRLVLLPFFYKSTKDQLILQQLTPKLKEIRKNHKNNLTAQTQAMMALYKEHKINPFSSFLLLIIQLPILFALYRVFLKGIPAAVGNALFLGLINLAKPNIFIILAAVLVTFWQALISAPKITKKNDFEPTARLSRQMALITPIWIAIILSLLPSAIGLYIFTTTLFSIIQQLTISKLLNFQNIKNIK